MEQKAFVLLLIKRRTFFGTPRKYNQLLLRYSPSNWEEASRLLLQFVILVKSYVLSEKGDPYLLAVSQHSCDASRETNVQNAIIHAIRTEVIWADVHASS